ncbi:hypothetical protein JVU11DRAFT_5749 [Chiua virens]|nr:hypothetical protein JVU11DRAFT_5749 [Chiua virens]
MQGLQQDKGACIQAMQDGFSYIWLDTCCIDKRNSAELGEAINSMYRWYQTSDVCYAYLYDVSDISQFTQSDWFSRGWTLQELIAPKKLKFFGKDWRFLGTREDLINQISEISEMCPEVLRSSQIPRDVTISQKMRWAAKRQTTKVEDRAYSLLGVLGVRLDPIYGIDDGAFEDLQHKLITQYSDQTLFSWYHTCTRPDLPSGLLENDADTPRLNATGLLASSPVQLLEILRNRRGRLSQALRGQNQRVQTLSITLLH